MVLKYKMNVLPKTHWYRCSKCNQTFLNWQDNFKEKICPFCLLRKIVHKDCGGIILEYDPNW